MADVVTSDTLFKGVRTSAVHLTGNLDTAAESAVVKVDISTFTDAAGVVATKTTIDKIEYKVDPAGATDANATSLLTAVTLEWAHTTADVIAILSGHGVIDWEDVGGNTDPGSTGSTGDILLTTKGFLGTYDITIWLRPQT